MESLAVMAGGAPLFLDNLEMKRYNLAMEQLSKARYEYARSRQQGLDYINKTLRDQRHASQTFTDYIDFLFLYCYIKSCLKQLSPFFI